MPHGFVVYNVLQCHIILVLLRGFILLYESRMRTVICLRRCPAVRCARVAAGCDGDAGAACAEMCARGSLCFFRGDVARQEGAAEPMSCQK